MGEVLAEHPEYFTRAAGQQESQAQANGKAAQPSADGGNGRGEKGRFTAGNRFGKGNPHYRRLARNRTLFLEAIGDDDLKALARQLHADALAGDREAARLVLAYVIGRPVDAVDPDQADLHEWQLLAEASPTRAEMLRAIVDDVDLDEALEVVRHHRGQRPQGPQAAFNDALDNLGALAGHQVAQEIEAKAKRRK
jgi:hypothetical protein